MGVGVGGMELFHERETTYMSKDPIVRGSHQNVQASKHSTNTGPFLQMLRSLKTLLDNQLYISHNRYVYIMLRQFDRYAHILCFAGFFFQIQNLPIFPLTIYCELQYLHSPGIQVNSSFGLYYIIHIIYCVVPTAARL